MGPGGSGGCLSTCMLFEHLSPSSKQWKVPHSLPEQVATFQHTCCRCHWETLATVHHFSPCMFQPRCVCAFRWLSSKVSACQQTGLMHVACPLWRAAHGCWAQLGAVAFAHINSIRTPAAVLAVHPTHMIPMLKHARVTLVTLSLTNKDAMTYVESFKRFPTEQSKKPSSCVHQQWATAEVAHHCSRPAA